MRAKDSTLKVNRVKIIPWYFYPECADRSLFKNRTSQMELGAVLKDIQMEKSSQTFVQDRTTVPDNLSSKMSVSTVSKLGLSSQVSTPARTDRGYQYNEDDSICAGTEVGMSSSKKQKIEFEEFQQMQNSEKKDKNRFSVALVVVSSHRKIMKLANNQAKQMNSKLIDSELGSLLDADNFS